MNGLSGNLIFIIVVLAGISILQFYQGRRLNITLMKHYVQGFEGKLKIRDQLYTWIGGYAGFKADYDINDHFIKKVEMTLTLLPRQSLFWLPFSYSVKRGDKLYIVLRPKFQIHSDAHIVKKFYYLFGASISETKDLTKGEVGFSDAKGFYTLYKEENDIQKLRKFVEASMDPKRLRHIAVVKETNVLFCLIKPDPYKTADEIKKFVDNFPKYFSK